MKEEFLKSFVACYRDIPVSVYWAFLLVFCLGTFFFLAFFGGRKVFKWLAGLLLVEYIVWFFSLAVFARATRDGQMMYNLIPFWSYRAYLAGTEYLLAQIFLNVVVFIPFGILLGCTFGRMKWWKVALIGGGFSVLIEILQFALKRGLAEFDDVFHNVMGCAIGFGIYVGIAFMVEKVSKSNSQLTRM